MLRLVGNISKGPLNVKSIVKRSSCTTRTVFCPRNSCIHRSAFV